MPISPATPVIVCSVVSTDVGAAMSFRGRIVSREQVGGTYRFAITKSGPSGKSTIRQGGQFVALPDVETFVGSATVSVEQGAEYDVRFGVEAGGHSYTCDPFVGGKI